MIKRIRYKLFLRIAKWAASKIGLAVVNESHLRKLCGWRLIMSYNDSYFGEPKGNLKGIVAELAHHLPARQVSAAIDSAKGKP